MANMISRPSSSPPESSSSTGHDCHTPEVPRDKLPPVETRICYHCDHTLVCENRDLRKAIQPVYAALRGGISRMHVNPDAIVQQISIYESDIGRYDDEIVDLEKVMRELKRKRGELQRVADANRSLISPIRRLPLEILTTIFRYVQDIPDVRLPLQLRKNVCQRVCHSWRTIILSNHAEFLPHLIARGQTPEHIERRRRALHEQLAITAPKPFSLVIEDFSSILMHGSEREDYGLPLEQPITEDPIFANSERWRSAKISLGPRTLRSLADFEGAVPQLTTLSLSSDRPFPGEDFESVSQLRMFADAPRLRTVMLCPPFYPNRTALPYEQLTHITIIGMDWSHIAYLFEHCRKLVLARIYAGRGPSPTDAIAETCATKLDVETNNHTFLPQTPAPVTRSPFTVISAPRLSRLVLHSLPDCDALEEMIQRSGCKITSLILTLRFLRGTNVSAQIVRRIVEIMPHVRNFEVTLDVLEGAATFIQLLFAEMSAMTCEGKPRVLPVLRRFSFTLIGRRPVCDQELVQLVGARMQCPEFMCLEVKCPLPDARIEELRAFSERGLEVYGLNDCDLKSVAINRGMASTARLSMYFGL
ncbi:hypothetical protein K523DRAFT_294533 [Schizophyllum commune Tattone D]|nr:hypothetical protein K523DRAFT_294533 [Schizophyllum commune Tattone D]